MSKEMEEEAIDCAILAVMKYNDKSDIAVYIKDKFDNKYGKCWCCFVGNFGATYYHKPNHSICFDLDQLRISLFKTS
ncbi:Dynein light chain [Meloidogyne graminicola]|uniref:Dynein light chain n=1 Tax=Meloidogyne graminicola TaxID=189291 RepID=A0A8S9ZTP5_9BILA|nr:Dynein light chain [Meloidogyne graminicola]